MVQTRAVRSYGTYGSGWRARRMFYEREVRHRRRRERKGIPIDWSKVLRKLKGPRARQELQRMIAQADREAARRARIRAKRAKGLTREQLIRRYYGLGIRLYRAYHRRTRFTQSPQQILGTYNFSERWLMKAYGITGLSEQLKSDILALAKTSKSPIGFRRQLHHLLGKSILI